MQIALAYAAVLLIWGTTPLALVWSASEFHYAFSAAVRMVAAGLLALPIVLWVNGRLPLDKRALRSYLAGSVGIFGSMLSVYWSSQYVPSGLIAVMFGCAPLLTAVVAVAMLGDRVTWAMWLGMFVSLLGLALIFSDQLSLAGQSVKGMAGLFVAVFLYALSSVLVKKVSAPVAPFQQTAGTLLISIPPYLLVFGLTGSAWPDEITQKTLLSVSYLVLVSSLLGFFLYYTVLKALSAGAVSLTMLVTPLIAMGLGALLNDEHFAPQTLAGAVCVCVGLLCYQWPFLQWQCRRLLHCRAPAD